MLRSSGTKKNKNGNRKSEMSLGTWNVRTLFSTRAARDARNWKVIISLTDTPPKKGGNGSLLRAINTVMISATTHTCSIRNVRNNNNSNNRVGERGKMKRLVTSTTCGGGSCFTLLYCYCVWSPVEYDGIRPRQHRYREWQRTLAKTNMAEF